MQSLSPETKNTWTLIFILFTASVIGSGIIVLADVMHNFWGYFLIWNLFLAWIPLGIAWFVRLRRLSNVALIALGNLWLLFFPNAPYLLTDLAHLRWLGMESSWLMVSIFILFALTGLFVGLTSLMWMHLEIRERWGQVTGWIFVLVSLAASGFGVYIGRFLRFNSWDIFTDPLYVVFVIKEQLFSPQTFMHAWGFSLMFTLLTAFCYVMTQQMGQMSLNPAIQNQ